MKGEKKSMYTETSYSHSLASQRQCVGAPAGSLVFPTGITNLAGRSWWHVSEGEQGENAEGLLPHNIHPKASP